MLDGRTLYFEKILRFLSVFDFNRFWREMTAQDLVAGKRGSRRHSTTSFKENVKVAETTYQMLEVLSFCDHIGRVCNLLHF